MSHFNITINDPYNYNIETIINDAVAKWDSIIVALPDYVISMNVSVNIEDLSDSVLGNAYPTGTYTDYDGDSVVDSGENLNVTGGVITFNESRIVEMRDTLRLDGNSTLYFVMLHEMGHVLGIGVWWNYFQLVESRVESDGFSRQYYNGIHAVREYRNYMNDTGGVLVGLPIEDNGGSGTVGSHPEEGDQTSGGAVVSTDNRVVDSRLHSGLDHELMTGWADGGDVILPLSRISIGFLHDMGFTVDYTQADTYLGFDAFSFETGDGMNGSGDLVCFLEGTKILCFDDSLAKDCYVPIESLKPGMLVITHKHGYVPIEMIGYRSFQNPGLRQNSLRTKNRLYVCNEVCYAGTVGRSGSFDGVMGSLVMTGCHSLLVDRLSEDEMVDMRQECDGRLLQTDDKYRLMSYMSSDCQIYDHEGKVVIWHLVLRHMDVFMNYGIYANGILVESCSRRMMEDYSDMCLIKN